MKRCFNCMNEYGEMYKKCPVCGYAEEIGKSSQDCLEAGGILQGRYIVGTSLGKSISSQFYIGWDAMFQRKIRIQEFFPIYCAERKEDGGIQVKRDKAVQFEEGLRQFLSHGKQMIRLYQEPDIITVYSCFEENNTAYITMEYRELETLEDKLKIESFFTREEASDILKKTSAAVKKLHALNIIHGQISPKNIWVTGNGKLVLKDFSENRYLCGREESLDYQTPGPWTDVYWLACLFCEMVTGKRIRNYTNLKKVCSEYEIDIDSRLRKVIKKALQRDYHERYRTVEEFEKAFFPVSDGRSLISAPKLFLGGGVILLLLILALSFLPSYPFALSKVKADEGTGDKATTSDARAGFPLEVMR